MNTHKSIVAHNFYSFKTFKKCGSFLATVYRVISEQALKTIKNLVSFLVLFMSVWENIIIVMSIDKDCSSNALIFETWWEIAEEFGPVFMPQLCESHTVISVYSAFDFSKIWSIYYHFDDTKASKYTGRLILKCYTCIISLSQCQIVSSRLSVTAWSVLDFIFKWKHLSTSLSVVTSSFINVSSFTKLHPNWKVTYEYMDMQVCWLHLCLRFHTAPSFCY